MVDGAMPRRYTLQPAAGDAPDMSVLSSEAETAAANGSSGGAPAADGDALRLVKPRERMGVEKVEEGRAVCSGRFTKAP
jgi:hypothetical protein